MTGLKDGQGVTTSYCAKVKPKPPPLFLTPLVECFEKTHKLGDFLSQNVEFLAQNVVYLNQNFNFLTQNIKFIISIFLSHRIGF